MLGAAVRGRGSTSGQQSSKRGRLGGSKRTGGKKQAQPTLSAQTGSKSGGTAAAGCAPAPKRGLQAAGGQQAQRLDGSAKHSAHCAARAAGP